MAGSLAINLDNAREPNSWNWVFPSQKGDNQLLNTVAGPTFLIQSRQRILLARFQ